MVRVHLRAPFIFIASVAQSVERWTENPGVAGSIPALGSIFSHPSWGSSFLAAVAQLVEHLTENQGVNGSTPFRGTSLFPIPVFCSGSSGVEHRLDMAKVAGSKPAPSTRFGHLAMHLRT